MPNDTIILREPLLDAKQNILGYHLSWNPDGRIAATEDDAVASLDELVRNVASTFIDEDGGWILENQLLFIDAGHHLPSDESLIALPPTSAIFMLDGTAMTDAGLVERIRQLHDSGYRFLLSHAELVMGDKSLLGLFSFIAVRFSIADIASQAKLYAAVKSSSTRIVASQIASWQDYDACAALGLDAFIGKLHLTPRPSPTKKALNSAQAVILQLLEMVRSNVDARELETVFKRDPTVTYKLLRFMNSAGMRSGAEIQSIRHAVTLLGYAPLYRWLSILLATAGDAQHSPVLMQTAILRGRFAELLGAAYLPAGEGENLFVAGMFSLLDRLLGIPMNELLDKIHLTDQVVEALVDRKGMYGPYLALAEACEINGSLASSLASSLQIEAEQVNQFHLEALAWMHRVSA